MPNDIHKNFLVKSTMFNKLRPKISVSEELLSASVHDKQLLDNNFSKSFQNPNEIFRNNTTAVEVIVKEIKHKGKRHIITNFNKKDNTESATIKKLDEDIKKLRNELDEANSNLEEAQRCFKVIIDEMKQRLDTANQQELQTQTKNLFLQLEKEKLKAILDSKSNLLVKLKKEFSVMKHQLKVVIKGMRFASQSNETDRYSDVKYDEFEKDLRNATFMAVTGNSLDNENILEHAVMTQNN